MATRTASTERMTSGPSDPRLTGFGAAFFGAAGVGAGAATAGVDPVDGCAGNEPVPGPASLAGSGALVVMAVSSSGVGPLWMDRIVSGQPRSSVNRSGFMIRTRRSSSGGLKPAVPEALDRAARRRG